MDEPRHDCLLMKHINEAASACINKSQRLICGHIKTYLHLQYSSSFHNCTQRINHCSTQQKQECIFTTLSSDFLSLESDHGSVCPPVHPLAWASVCMC